MIDSNGNGIQGDPEALKVYRLLQDRGYGKENAIPTQKIALLVGIPPSDSTAHNIRIICKRIRHNFNKPVISCGKGMYLAETNEEIEEFKKKSRSIAIANLVNYRDANKLKPEPPKVQDGFFEFAREGYKQ